MSLGKIQTNICVFRSHKLFMFLNLMGSVYIDFFFNTENKHFIHHSEILSSFTSYIIFYPAVYPVFE